MSDFVMDAEHRVSIELIVDADNYISGYSDCADARQFRIVTNAADLLFPRKKLSPVEEGRFMSFFGGAMVALAAFKFSDLDERTLKRAIFQFTDRSPLKELAYVNSAQRFATFKNYSRQGFTLHPELQELRACVAQNYSVGGIDASLSNYAIIGLGATARILHNCYENAQAIMNSDAPFFVEGIPPSIE